MKEPSVKKFTHEIKSDPHIQIRINGMWKHTGTIKQRSLTLLILSKEPYSITSYCMVCAYVREDNPRALASGLSHVHMRNHTITALLHENTRALCAL